MKTKFNMGRASRGVVLLAGLAMGAALAQPNDPCETRGDCDRGSGAGAAALEPGLWELRSRPELSGVPVLSAPRSSRVCLTPQDIAAGNIDLASIPTCKVIGGAWEGASLRLRFDCRALPAGFRIEGVVEPRQRSLTGRIELRQAHEASNTRASFVYHQEGRWVAASCVGN